MPHALLLSPDDQAVNAITGVLEEMSVTCERPLDGASAAQKLNSHIFDLVLVDCENLPAAKLIFDVCRRGKTGNNPVPIAIVDGRAGLPTAFRLGADLILTKPVAKDQARSTIRTAVSRVRRDVRTNAGGAELPDSAAMAGADGVEERERAAAAAAASSQMTSFADPAPSFVPTPVAATVPDTVSATASTATMHSAVDEDAVVKPAGPKLTLPSAFFATSRSSESSPATAVSPSSEPRPPLQPSDDPALAKPERLEPAKSKQKILQPAKAAPKQPAAEASVQFTSSYPQGRKQTRLLAALLMLTLAGGGLYAAWTYQPGFRAIAQPQIHRLLVLGGMALPPAPETSPAKPLQPAPRSATPVRVSGSPTHPTQIQGPNPRSAAASATASATDPATTSPAASAPVQSPGAPSPAVASPLSTAINASAPVAVKLEVNQPSALGKDTPATVSHTPLPGEDSAILLSSQGAEKRLVQGVPPTYPVEARAGEADGTVVLKEVVDETGKVEGVRLVEGNATLGAAAIKAVKQWRYRPYVRDGQAQPFQTIVIIDFQHP